MARGKKTGGANFVKGDPRAGRPKMPPDLKAAKSLTQMEAQELLIKFLHMDLKELRAFCKSKGGSAIDHWVAKLVLIGITSGDERRLNFMFEKLFGKAPVPTQQLNINLLNLPLREAIDIGRQAIEYLQEAEDD